jgi:hypothetical protein
MWVTIGIRQLNAMLLSLCELRENRHNTRMYFLMSGNQIAFACVPQTVWQFQTKNTTLLKSVGHFRTWRSLCTTSYLGKIRAFVVPWWSLCFRSYFGEVCALGRTLVCALCRNLVKSVHYVVLGKICSFVVPWWSLCLKSYRSEVCALCRNSVKSVLYVVLWLSLCSMS